MQPFPQHVTARKKIIARINGKKNSKSIISVTTNAIFYFFGVETIVEEHRHYFGIRSNHTSYFSFFNFHQSNRSKRLRRRKRLVNIGSKFTLPCLGMQRQKKRSHLPNLSWVYPAVGHFHRQLPNFKHVVSKSWDLCYFSIHSYFSFLCCTRYTWIETIIRCSVKQCLCH